MQIEGSGALVAGGASGLGEATARALQAHGASVTIADLNEEKGNALARELAAQRSSGPTSPTSRRSRPRWMRRDDLRISVCCAGIGWAERVASKRGPAQLQPFETVIKVNLIGTFNVLRFAAAKMIQSEPTAAGERGVCVNTASIAAFDGQIGQISYSASKGGIVGMTLPAARDLAREGVRVCTIAPGTFDTPLLGGLSEETREELGQGDPVPAAARPPGGVRGARAPHRRERDAQRRGDPARRRAADASEVATMSSQELSPADRSSLAAERGPINMAVGGLLVVDAEPPLTREMVAERIAERIHLVPRLRQRLEEPPLGIANPVWTDDTGFDLDWHVRQASLPEPGGEAELGAFVGREFSHRLDRARPLWEATLDRGTRPGSQGAPVQGPPRARRRDGRARDGGAGARPVGGAARDTTARNRVGATQVRHAPPRREARDEAARPRPEADDGGHAPRARPRPVDGPRPTCDVRSSSRSSSRASGLRRR